MKSIPSSLKAVKYAFFPVRTLAVSALYTLLFLLLTHANLSAAPLTELKVDYAYYSPPSLVLKHFGWLEQAVKTDNVKVKWVFSAGSNRALEYLNSGSVDFASTAGLAAVLSRSNGNPVKSIYMYSKPEWVALVVRNDSQIKSVAGLKGKRVAATKGTDAYLFLLRSLHEAGLEKKDISHASLQHADGKIALEQGHVDAWIGLDPLMAASEIESGSKIIYRNADFNTFGLLNTTDSFLEKNPETVRTVTKAYEKARLWIIANPKQAAEIIAAEAKISVAVATRQLQRNDFSNSSLSQTQVKALKAAAPILKQENLVRNDVDVEKTIESLIVTHHKTDLSSK